MLLTLASVVFLGSESLSALDHMLLSQIWDFRFRRLLRLAGSRWRYSSPPPHGWLTILNFTQLYNHFARTEQKTLSNSTSIVCLPIRCLEMGSSVVSRLRFRGNVLTKQLPSSGHVLWFHYSLFRTSCHNMLRIASLVMIQPEMLEQSADS
jgi:hypothetical protein